MLLIQLVVVLFAAYAFVRVWFRFRRGTVRLGEFVLWGLFWIAAAVLVLRPVITQQFAKILGVGRGADAVFYIGLVTLCYACFRLYFRIRDLEQQITQLVRKLALAAADRPPASTGNSPGAPNDAKAAQ